MILGQIYKTKNDGQLIIIKYTNSESVEVEFINTGYRTTTQAVNIRNGRVKDYLKPSIYGIGFLGGKKIRARLDGKMSPAYSAWHDMIRRCYDHKLHDKHPTYKGCSVSKEWHNFQEFADWYFKHKPDNDDKFHVDKDTKVIGNKIYSPDTCSLVSPSENVSFSTSRAFELQAPDGTIHKGSNVKRFCIGKNLNPNHIGGVLNGKFKQHKGWTKPKFKEKSK